MTGERINPEVKRVAVRAIRQMVGEDLDWNGPVRDLVDLVIIRSNVFEHDNVLTAKARLGTALRRVASMVGGDEEFEPSFYTKPEFWQTETGGRVHRALRGMFDEERRKKG